MQQLRRSFILKILSPTSIHDSSGECDVFEIAVSKGRAFRRVITRLPIEVKSVRISLSILSQVSVSSCIARQPVCRQGGGVPLMCVGIVSKISLVTSSRFDIL